MQIRIYTPEPLLRHPWVMLRDLWRDLAAGRELAWRLFVRDLSAQYRQTVLGYVWAFLPPVVSSATFIYLQSQGIVNVEGTEVPYAAFVMMGTLLWQTFVESMQCPLLAINGARAMLTKINFPREAILVAGIYMLGFNFLIRFVLLVAVMVIWQVAPGATLILFPLVMFGLVLCGLAIGMALIPIGGLYGDISRSIPIVAQFWMLLTPVVYPAGTTGLAGWLATWNPISPLITTARATLTGQPLEQLPLAVIVTVVAFFVSLLGLFAFRAIMPHLIARMGG